MCLKGFSLLQKKHLQKIIQLEYNPINMVTNKPSDLVVLMRYHINEGLFTRKCMSVLPGGQNKVAIITR